MEAVVFIGKYYQDKQASRKRNEFEKTEVPLRDLKRVPIANNKISKDDEIFSNGDRKNGAIVHGWP